jgi:hypothetical protein
LPFTWLTTIPATSSQLWVPLLTYGDELTQIVPRALVTRSPLKDHDGAQTEPGALDSQSMLPVPAKQTPPAAAAITPSHLAALPIKNWVTPNL